MQHIPDASAGSISPVVINNVVLGSHLNADENRSYNSLDSFYRLGRVNHGVGEYVRDGVTTNGIESIWALVKRTYIGTHHWWSLKHTQRYLDGCAFRQNVEKGDEALNPAVCRYESVRRIAVQGVDSVNATFTDILLHTERPFLERARARPFLKWAGGKRTLIPEIARRLPDTIHTYWEPFLGGGAVFFALDSRIDSAQLSDINAELALTYQTVRNNPEPLIDLLEQHAGNHSKSYYARVRNLVDIPSSIELAARLYISTRLATTGCTA